MTIEEKAKAYDEAIERAKVFKEHLLEINEKDYADEMNYIFPTLKESKDERIRKSVVKYFTSSITNPDYEICGVPFREVIAWLEKLGEQKPIEVRTTGYWHVEDVEQKSAWSKEDEQYLEDTLNLLEGHRSKNTYGDVVEWIKELKERVQSKQEWSKEDKRELDSIYQIIDFLPISDSHLTKENKKAMLDWLKSLKNRVQPQPTWKPSESQMKWLHDAIESTLYEPRKQALISLYSDLMKLKENKTT